MRCACADDFIRLIQFKVDNPHAAVLGWLADLQPMCEQSAVDARLRALLTTGLSSSLRLWPRNGSTLTSAFAEATLHHAPAWLALASVVDCDAAVADRALSLFATPDAKAAARATLDALAVFVAESKNAIDSKDAAPIEKALAAWTKANKKVCACACM